MESGVERRKFESLSATEQPGGLQPVPLPLWAQGFHLAMAVRIPTARGSYEASVPVNVKALLVLVGAQPKAWHTTRAPGTPLVFHVTGAGQDKSGPHSPRGRL